MAESRHELGLLWDGAGVGAGLLKEPEEAVSTMIKIMPTLHRR
jgi:hypothetical protein